MSISEALVSIGRRIREDLPREPLKALSVYEDGLTRNATSPLVVDGLRRRYANTMELLVAATRIGTDEGLRRLPEAFATARRRDQKRLLAAVVDKLAEVGHTAEQDENSKEYEALRRMGRLVRSLVLEGTLQQQFFCKLATRLGFVRATALPPTVVELVAVPMISALHDVIRVGAETTRDSAIEGMGALLKLAREGKLPVERFQAAAPIDDGLGDPDVNRMYARRLERRRKMVLAVADPDCCGELLDELDEAVETLLDPLRTALDRTREKFAGERKKLEEPRQFDAKRKKQHDEWVRVLDERAVAEIKKLEDELQTVLYTRADLLRVLPAIVRQNRGTGDIRRFVALLCRAARTPGPRSDDSSEILVAYARYQESVFRTIDILMKRDDSWKNFDGVISDAVKSIPRIVAGLPQVCNAQVRATVALLRTAVHVVRRAGPKSKTRTALQPLFDGLGDAQPWLNPAIAEGCYRALPDLLPYRVHDALSRPALEALFRDLRRVPSVDDLPGAHRRLIATSCFRRLLIALADRIYEQDLEQDLSDSATEGSADADLWLLLRAPDPLNAFRIFHRNGRPAIPSGSAMAGNVAVEVISAIAYECDLLRNAVPVFSRWRDRSTVDQLLLTRMLAAQLHAVSRDAPEVGRYPLLQRIFGGMETVTMQESEAVGKAWDFLALLPPEAVEAAEPDINRFVEYRGRRKRSEAGAYDDGDDLPGHVLAMISPKASDRIAGAIAREIDLNLRHDRARDTNSDFGESLYQVMLREPTPSIFDHLMPRIEGSGDRQMVALLRNHVAEVLKTLKLRPDEVIGHLRKHIVKLHDELLRVGGATLVQLAYATVYFEHLISERMWMSVRDHELTRLFDLLDELDERTHAGGSKGRTILTPIYGKRLVELRDDVANYLDLPVGHFAARSARLASASRIAASIETELAKQDGLQPPERILLVALMYHLRDVFERANRWYCIDAQTYRDKNDKDGFWIIFAVESNHAARTAERIKSHFANSQNTTQVLVEERNVRERLEELIKKSGSEPPRFAEQSQHFEEFAVDWMSSDLDLEALRNALGERWPPWYRVLFDAITRPWAVIAILLPFAFTCLMHALELHWFEGFGFWLIAATIVGAAIYGLLRFLRVVTHTPPEDSDPKKRGYWFRCMMPQLAGLIAAPMALIVKFEHSYQFPFTASAFAVGLLLLLAFQTTRFFIERESVDRSASSKDMSPRERKKVRMILSIALAQAFGIAVLFSVIFADSHYRAAHPPEPGEKSHYGHHDKKMPDFMAILPHQAFLDWGHLVVADDPLSNWVRKNGQITFYPTIILSWTALGLFFGLVLEGIGKGKHLRGHSAKEKH